jgi:NAD(P)-dependent dehydrogenase (short-subunit alcohol dehydrogenase family)
MADAAASPVVAIVGGGGGIGRGVASAFLRRGYRAALIDRDAARLEDSVRRLEDADRVNTYVCDATNDVQCRETMDRLVQDFGGIDVLVYSAGLTQVSPCKETQLSVYRRVMDVNLFGAIAVVQAALPRLIQSRGRIVVLSSICGFAPLIGRTGYCASKYALHGFFETLRCELAQDGVSVTIVCPSFVDTDFAARGLAGDGSVLSFDRSTSGAPLDPSALGESIARAALDRRRLLVLSRQGKLSYWLTRLAPRLYDRLMSRRFRVELDRKNA